MTSYPSSATRIALVREIVFPSRVSLRNKYRHSGLSLRMTALLQLFQRQPFLSSFHICWMPATRTLMKRQEVRSCCGVLARDKDEPGWRKKDDFLVMEEPVAWGQALGLCALGTGRSDKLRTGGFSLGTGRALEHRAVSISPCLTGITFLTLSPGQNFSY